MSTKSKKKQTKAKPLAAVATPINAPPPPRWEGSIEYDPARPNTALGEALLAAWAGEDISMIRRVEDGETHLWVFWSPRTVPLLKAS